MKKIIALVLAAMMLLACCSAVAEAPEGYPEKVDGIDFGGATIYIHDYWSSSSDDRKAEPTEEEQAQYDYRDWIMETYNCHIIQIADGDWGSNATQMMNFVSAPDGSYRLYIIEPGSVLNLVNNGYTMPWSDKYMDLNDDKWNAADKDFMTIGDQVWGLYPGKTEPRQCLYFNKRVLSEAGIEAADLYDLQAAGKWTWSAFTDMLAQITKDVDNDGTIDVWGMTGDANDMYFMAVFSNGGSFFDFVDGKLAPTVGEDAALNALNWARDEVFFKYFYQQPADGNWDYYKEAFKAGNIGFYMYQCYGGFNDNAELADMEDEWGMVAFPVPNEGDNYMTTASDNITLIPNVYDEETAAKLALIYDLWTNDTPGYDDDDSWIGNKYNFTDERAVDESYATLRENGHSVINKALYLGTLNDIVGAPLTWNLSWETPAEAIEAAMPTWQSLCDAFNAK